MADVSIINGYDIKDSAGRTLINNLTAEVRKPLGRWIFIGDSYNVDDRTDSSGKGWGTRIIEMTGLPDSYSFAIGGTAFGKSGSLNMNNVLSSNIGSVTDPDTITDILVGAGYNEWEQTTSDIDDGINSFITYAKSVCSNARIHIAFLGRSCLYDRNEQFPRVCRRYQFDAGLYGAAYITNSEAIINDTHMMESDGIHPTSGGLRQIASALSNYVVYGQCSYYSGLVTGTLTPVTGLSFNSNARLYSTAFNSVITTLLYNLKIEASGNITISGNTYTDIAEISRCSVMGADNDFHTFKCFVYYKETALGSFITGLVSFKIYRNTSNKLMLAARALPFGNNFSAWEDMDVYELYTYKDPAMNTYPILFGNT